MTELRKALERPVAGLVFDENRKNAVREKAFTAKRGGSALRRGAAAALVCTALCVTAVAAGPSLWQYIQARQGPFAGLAQTVEGAVCTSGGIEIQVLSALADDVRGEVYFTVRDVEGDRLDSQLTLRCGRTVIWRAGWWSTIRRAAPPCLRPECPITGPRRRARWASARPAAPSRTRSIWRWSA